ncbi:unnamed protein product [Leuciscus chuanchicus]
MGDKGRDMMGVPLLDTVRIEHIWRVQMRHVKCIQDPPGTSANTLNFQLYLLEGLNRWNQGRAAASISTKSSPLLTYAGQVVQSINTNSLNVFGEKLVPTFQPPAQYTDEANCNPPTVQPVHPSSQSAAASSLSTAPSSQSAAASSQSAAPSSLFAAASSQFAFSQSAAPSFQSAFSQPAAVASSSRSTTSIVQYAPGSPTQVPEELLAVDDQNIPGMDRVDRLAEYLVELRTSTGLTLSRQQVDDIVCLWQSLLEYDKQRVKFAARHQDRLTTGRFRSPKKKAVFTPGVDSLKRSVLASTASPAQWPDCCRLVEAIFIRLCRIHPSPREKEKDTTLQLVEVNQTTLVQWHNGRVKKQDQTLLLQGINLPDPLGVAAQALPPARVLAVAPPQVQGEQHIYKLPQSTAGQAKLKRRITGNTTEAVIPKLATLRLIFPLPVGNLQPQLPEPVLPSPSPTVPLASHTTPTLTLFVVPQSRLPIAPATPSFVLPPPATVSQSQPTVPRPYHRKVEANTCRNYMSKPKSHKGLGDEEWMSRLRRFANTGIDKCPRQVRGQASLFGGPQSCLCGFHPPKVTSNQPAPTFVPVPTSTSVKSPRRPPFNISVFENYGLEGLSARAKPNLNIPRRIHLFTKLLYIYYLKFFFFLIGYIMLICIMFPSSHSDSPAAITTVTTSTSPSTSVRTSPSFHTFMAVPAPSSSPADSSIPALPAEMRKTIPSQDQRWIVSTLFQAGRLRPDLKLWYEPPVPSLIYHQAPSPDRFFTHRLLVWMPYHQWKVRLLCPVCGKQLTGYGIHKRARKVLDIDRYYLMVTETLRCTICRTNYLSTSQTVLDQLDLPHRRLFRLILTYKYVCDIRVIRLLRERTLGNSPARLAKQLKENHGEEWLDRLAHYMGECAAFVDCPSSLPVVFQEPPEPFEVPTSKWLLTVYGKDIVSRLDHIKAGITSTFGTILKMDSTKKITKKLAGTAKGTAQWLSSVGNETGQILISVLTAQDGPGLDSMISGLISRYQQAGVDPPVLLYVDTGCCIEEGQSKLQTRFGGWPTLNIRLDIWHFMRRLATGCTTDAHPLYPTFMVRLSECIFEWDPHDIALLRQAKREQLEDERLLFISGNLLNRRITKKELSLYCRRRTRGLKGEKGKDLLGVPLLDIVRIEHIWRVQKRHVKCIQDVPGVLLYTEMGTTTTKGSIVLTKYRCARGSTSLESFHLHLNRFIPGSCANTLNFQLYLLEGLNRWNQDRAAASVVTKPSSLLTYAGDVVHCLNTNSLKVIGRKYVPTFQPPAKYTGELIGVDYLLSQTGQPLQRVNPDAEETDQLLEDINVEELEDEGFEEDLSDDPTMTLFYEDLTTTAAVSSVLTAAASSIPPAAASSVPPAAASSVLTAAASSVLTAAVSSVLTAAASSVPPAAASSVLTAAVSSVLTAAVSSVLTASSTSDVSTGQPDVSAPDSPTQVSERDLAVDDKNLPGMDRVDSLADYLLQLRDKTGLTICNQQVNDIVALWHKLLDYDKEQVVFAARQQDTRLCRIHRSPRRKGKSSSTRWTLILHDYGTIRQLLLNNGPIMQNTNLQLVEVNQATLVQWHNEKIRRQDLSVLLQGINLPAPLPVASEPLPPASVRPASLKRRITSMQPEKTAEVVRAKLPSQRLLLPMLQGIMGPVQVLTTGLSSSATCVSINPCFHCVCCPYAHSKPFFNSPGQQCSFTLCNSPYTSATRSLEKSCQPLLGPQLHSGARRNEQDHPCAGPEVDCQHLISHFGKLRPDLKLWYEPPVPALIYHQTPTPDRFFTHRLMVRVSCPDCGKNLKGYGVHKRARKVLDIDRYYLMVTETLRCTVCPLNYRSTSQTVRDQLDLPHQKMFRLILTRKREPPEPIDIPTSRWLLSVYGRDILCRIDHIKASITSTFGTILKMDSTNKITECVVTFVNSRSQISWLAMDGGQHHWVSSIGNEVGQILTSVLSVQEGPGLDRMVAGIMER